MYSYLRLCGQIKLLGHRIQRDKRVAVFKGVINDKFLVFMIPKYQTANFYRYCFFPNLDIDNFFLLFILLDHLDFYQSLYILEILTFTNYESEALSSENKKTKQIYNRTHQLARVPNMQRTSLNVLVLISNLQCIVF